MLGQVFTPEPIANLLISGLPEDCSQLLDMGAGRGALSLAANKKLKLNNLLMLECDTHHANWLQKNMQKKGHVLSVNALNADWEEQWDRSIESSAVVSNPPYGMLELTAEQINELRLGDIAVPLQGNWVRGDAAFFAKAWKLTGKGNAFAFIVTAPLMTGLEYRPFRERIVKELSNLTITQLPERVFPNAEVRAFLVNGVRARNRRRNVLLRKSDLTGKITDEFSVDWLAAISRMDIEYYRACERLGISGSENMLTLSDVGTKISRGSRSHNEFVRLGIGAFHTTDFARQGEKVELLQGHVEYHCASKGDILIPRVGSRCLSRHARVIDGAGPYTDCVFRLRAPVRMQARIWKTIASEFGREWREAHASGNCARHLTQSTLLSMPLI